MWLLAITTATVTFLFEVRDRFCPDLYLPDFKTCIIEWTDDHIPQHANQVRFLLSECPRGQSLPTIKEEDEEDAAQSDTESDDLSAHTANISKSASESGKFPGVIDIQARSV